MKAEHLNSFYEATKNIFRLMLDSETKLGQISIGTGIEPEGKKGVLVDISGDLRGLVYFIFTEEIILKMVKFMANIQLKELDDFAESTISELVNIISGNALSKLEKLDISCSMSPPYIFRDDLNAVFRRERNLIRVPISSDLGDFEMNINISE